MRSLNAEGRFSSVIYFVQHGLEQTLVHTYNITLQTESCCDANFVITGGIAGAPFINMD